MKQAEKSAPPPRPADVRDTILAAIQSGEFIERLPSEPELAARYGVPRPAIAAALNFLAAAGVLVRKRGSGTYVKQPAGRRALDFELLLPESVNLDFFTPLGVALAQALDEHGHRLRWPRGFAPMEVKDVVAEAKRLVGSDVSGVFFVPIEFEGNSLALNEAIVTAFGELPVVLLDRCMRSFPDRSGFDVVGIDNRRASYVLTEHLVRHHKSQRIAFIRRQDSASTVDARVVGFEEAVRHADTVKRHVATGEPSRIEFVQALVNDFDPDAVICANDSLARSFMEAVSNLTDRKRRRPLIVGFDDLPFAESLGLTTIHQPLTDIGSAAAGAMIERLARPKLPGRDILLNFTLETRRSCCASAPTGRTEHDAETPNSVVTRRPRRPVS